MKNWTAVCVELARLRQLAAYRRVYRTWVSLWAAVEAEVWRKPPDASTYGISYWLT